MNKKFKKNWFITVPLVLTMPVIFVIACQPKNNVDSPILPSNDETKPKDSTSEEPNSNPAQPAQSNPNPTQPAQPAQPNPNPSQPAQPAQSNLNPTQPTQPTQPKQSAPSQPATTPTNPTNSTTTTPPTKPESDSKPAEPTSTPNKPTDTTTAPATKPEPESKPAEPVVLPGLKNSTNQAIASINVSNTNTNVTKISLNDISLANTLQSNEKVNSQQKHYFNEILSKLPSNFNDISSEKNLLNSSQYNENYFSKLKNYLSEIASSYIENWSKVNSSISVEDIKKYDLIISSFEVTLSNVSKETSLDLASILENYFLVNKLKLVEAVTSGEVLTTSFIDENGIPLLESYLKVMLQKQFLLIKKAQQEIAIARTIEANLNFETIKNSLNKHSSKLSQRTSQFLIPNTLVEKITNLEDQISNLENNLTDIQAKIVSNNIETTGYKKEEISNQLNISNLKKLYFNEYYSKKYDEYGFENLKSFPLEDLFQAGIKKTIDILKLQLNKLTNNKMESIENLTSYYHEAFLSKKALVAFNAQIRIFKKEIDLKLASLTKFKKDFTDKMNSLTEDYQKEPYQKLLTSLDNYSTNLNPISSSLDILTNKDSDTYLEKLFQNGIAIFSAIELSLLQIAIDNFDDLNQEDLL